MATHFIGGLNGVGKSTVVNAVVERNAGYERLHTTSLFMAHLGILAGDYDQLRALPDDYKARQNNAMLEALLSRPSTLDREQILDSHFLNIVEGHTTRLIDGSWPRRLGSLVLVTADVEIVQERLSMDTVRRQRRLFAPDITPGQQRDAISQYLADTTDEFMRIANLAGCPNKIIQNNDCVEATATELMDFLSTLSKNEGQTGIADE